MPTQPDAVTACRDALFGGTTDIHTLAAALGRSARTIERHIAAGLPVIRIGRDRRFDLVQARQWLMARERRHDVPRRGRPRAASCHAAAPAA